MKKIIIRPEKIKDYPEIFQLVKEAFENAPYADHDEHYLVNRLRDSDTYIPELALVAVLNDIIVGHIMFTKIKVGRHTCLSLAPVSVLPNYQKQGIGSALIDAGHKKARILGYQVVIVLGHEKYYPRFGYKPCHDYQIACPFDAPKEAFMVYELQSGSLNNIKGKAKYPKAFLR
jgi:predicted N-acetyltransferase YhbS